MNKKAQELLDAFLQEMGWTIAIDFYDEDGVPQAMIISDPSYAQDLKDMLPIDMEKIAEADDTLH